MSLPTQSGSHAFEQCTHLTALDLVKGEAEYLPEHFAAAPATAFEVPAPVEGERHYRERFLLIWRRHRLSVGVDGDELNGEVPDFEAFDRKLQSLARALPRADSLLWACSFTGEPSNRTKSDRSGVSLTFPHRSSRSLLS